VCLQPHRLTPFRVTNDVTRWPVDGPGRAARHVGLVGVRSKLIRARASPPRCLQHRARPELRPSAPGSLRCGPRDRSRNATPTPTPTPDCGRCGMPRSVDQVRRMVNDDRRTLDAILAEI
jgi:hypothetical protein